MAVLFGYNTDNCQFSMQTLFIFSWTFKDFNLMFKFPKRPKATKKFDADFAGVFLLDRIHKLRMTRSSDCL